MLDLCGLLGITVNDLLSGEAVTMEKYNEKTEKALIDMVRQKEETDKKLLSLEVVIGVLSTTFLLVLVLTGAYLRVFQAPVWVTVVMIVVGFVQFIVFIGIALKIEQTAGYYECPECGHRYVPSFSAVNLAPHMGRTRRMRCPNCGKKAWQKKVISKE